MNKMIKIYLAIGIVFSSLSIHAQDFDLLLGQWQYADIGDKKGVDEQGLAMMEKFFGSIFFDFKADGTFEALLMEQLDEGTWEVDKDKKSFWMNSTKGEGSQIKVLELSENKMRILMQSKVDLILHRIVDTELMDEMAFEMEEPLEAEVPPVKHEGQSTIDLISKQWFIVDIQSEEKSERAQVLASGLLLGGYYEFSKNGKYKMNIMEVEDEGTWRISDGGKTITLHNKKQGAKTFFTINELTEDRLSISKGDNKDAYIMSPTLPSEDPVD